MQKNIVHSKYPTTKSHDFQNACMEAPAAAL